VPPANARAPTEAIPGAELRVFEGGHLNFAERAADVNREVRPCSSVPAGRNGGTEGLKGQS
jgi:hypothetical protein